ncbi:MAG: aminodeoxychorismate synthase, component I, partial [Sphingomicrobium sp.]
MTASFILFDDARDGGAPCRLYEAPVGEVVARTHDEVAPTLSHLRAAVAGGKHVAGWIGYDAGYALEPRLGPFARTLGDTPLLWFGLFDSFRVLGPDERAAFLGNPAAAWLGRPRPRIDRAAYLAAATRVRENLFAGDFYQANLTFGCDVPVAGPPLAAYAQMRERSNA